jgi:hypothetical protein
MNTFETSAVTFAVGIIVGAILEWKYGSKVESSVKADVATLKTDVAEIKAKVAAKV